MKKRFLSLLLAMVMIVSMVPVQAFAEEADETPELLEEAVVEEIVPETTEEIVPETTEEIVPETTEEIVPETTEETVPEILEEPVEAEALVEAEAPAEGTRTVTVSMRVGEKRNLSMIEGLADYAFAVEDADKALATIEDGSVLALSESFAIPEDMSPVVIGVTATKEGAAPVTIEVVIYAALSGIELHVNDQPDAVTEHTLNLLGENKSFTVSAEATDGGPLGDVKWTQSNTVRLTKSAGEDGAVIFTGTGRVGVTRITAACQGFSATLTVNTVKVPEKITIKVPDTARTVNNIPILTAGQKLSLSTDIPKNATDKDVTWDIPSGFYFDYRDYNMASLDMTLPEGAAASGEEWNAIASISSNGLLRTKAGVTTTPAVVLVRAYLTSSYIEGQGPRVACFLPVIIQPPADSFFVYAEPFEPEIAVEAMEGGVNRKYPYPEDYDINDGPFVLYTDDFQPDLLAGEVSWKIRTGTTAAKVQTPEEYFAEHPEAYNERLLEDLLYCNARIVTPKAPGKLTFTATATDGKGAAYTGSINFYGDIDHVNISASEHEDSLRPGDQVKFTAAAFYDEAETLPVTGGTYTWAVQDYDGATNFATISKKGVLTITDKVNRPAKLTVSCVFETKDDAEGQYYYVDVVPANEQTLALAVKETYDSEIRYRLLSTVDPEISAADQSWMEILPVWLDAEGIIVMDEETGDPIAVEGIRYKVSGKACSFDQATGKLTFNKVGTTTITASAVADGKTQRVTHIFKAMDFTTKTVIRNKPADGVITVVGGSSLTLKAVNWSSETTKATDQSVFWQLIPESAEYASIDGKTGKLTTKKVTEDYTITACVVCAGAYEGEEQPFDTVNIHIVPSKKQYTSTASSYWNPRPAGNTEDAWFGTGYFDLYDEDYLMVPYEDFWYRVYSYGRELPSRITDVAIDNPRFGKVLKEDDSVYGVKVYCNAKTGPVTFTVKGQVLVGGKWNYDIGDWEGGEWIDAPSAKFTLKAVKPVTSIKVTRPTDKDGNELPLYVGKSLRLKATVNKDATNKKVKWHVGYDPYDDLDNPTDKTSIKSNGVLKVDKSFWSVGRTYYVWATSEDGFACSEPIPIQAYAMTGAIKIASVGDWPNGGYHDYLNNRTVTIKQGESLEFGALVSDVNGDYEGANPDITWTISGKKDIVEKLYEGIDGDEDVDVLGLKGLKPGTVTIKAAAKDGSRKTATFKLIVSQEKYENMAKINDVYYDDLQEALDAAEDWDTVTLLQDVNLDETLTFNKAATKVLLNLNGHNIHCETQRAIHILQGDLALDGKGTVSSNNPVVASSVIRVGDNNAEHYSSLSVGGEVTISTPSCYGITVFGSATEYLDIYGNVTSTAPANKNYDGCAISTNGTDNTPSEIRVYGGNISAANTNAIYMPSGKLEVYNDTVITGLTGIYVKSGNTTIYNGTINGVGEKKDYTYHGNGGVSTGDALVVESCGYPNGAPIVTIMGGTFNSTNAKSVGVYQKDADTSPASVNYYGGTFNPELN